jgi:hypothetical protein
MGMQLASGQALAGMARDLVAASAPVGSFKTSLVLGDSTEHLDNEPLSSQISKPAKGRNYRSARRNKDIKGRNYETIRRSESGRCRCSGTYGVDLRRNGAGT